MRSYKYALYVSDNDNAGLGVETAEPGSVLEGAPSDVIAGLASTGVGSSAFFRSFWKFEEKKIYSVAIKMPANIMTTRTLELNVYFFIRSPAFLEPFNEQAVV